MKKIITILLLFWPVISVLNAADRVIPGKVIKGDETWFGRIIVTGDVVVAPGGRLMINPGTEVLFQAEQDDKHSGNDKLRGELIVRGILIARGTIDGKIRFSSAAKQPRMQDWYGIVISNPKRASTIEYAVIEYAYNGLNIKKSRPLIRNCQIQFNYNCGVIAEVGAAPKLSGNIISDNGYAGVICKTGARPLLSDNVITKNDVGIVIFGTAQPNLGSLVSGKGHNAGKNGIFDNHSYNLYNHSMKDIKAENNSWGSKNADKIMATIYDGSDERKYGLVDINPILGARLNMEQKMLLAQNATATDKTAVLPEQKPANQPPTEKTPEAPSTDTAQNEFKKPVTIAPESTAALKLQPAKKIAQEDTAAISVKETPPPEKQKNMQESINYNQVFLDVFLDKGREIIKKVRPVITNPERGLRAHGRVIVRVMVGKKGKVLSAKVLRGLNAYYDELAKNAAKKFLFRPGTIKGTPVIFETSIIFEF